MIRVYPIGVFLVLIAQHLLGQSVNISGIVQDQFGPLPGAKVAIEGTTIEVATNVKGEFVLNIDAGRYNLIAGFVMYSDSYQVIEPLPGDSLHLVFVLASAFDVEQDVSVGSRSGARSLLESTVPVDIISPQAISSSGQVELGQILHYAAPSFHSTHQTISDGTDHIDPVTLRGLGPDQVLVLINGKRRHTSALLNVNGTIGRGTVGTDFNAIPYGAIDRIEILRDGAAAQYGSDAIAGVVNIVLKQQTGITYLDSQMGINKEGDGDTQFYTGNVGFDIGDGGYINFTLEYRNRSATNRSGAYTGSVYSSDTELDRSLIESKGFFDQTGYDGHRIMEVGNAAVRNISFFVNTEIPISRATSFYAHGGRNFRDGQAAGFYRLPKDRKKVVEEIYPNGFSPVIDTDIQDDAMTLGFKGVKNNWNIDFSNTIGVNQIDFNVLNSNNASMGGSSPTRFYSGGFRYSQNTTNLDISRTFNWLQGVSIAFGSEMRIENYEILAGEEASWSNGQDSVDIAGTPSAREFGAQVFPGFQPENELNEFRTNNGWYIDTESKITEQLLIGLAARYETYNDFGDQVIWKASGRYKLAKQLSFNTGYSTGFRAPSLHQLHFNNISTQFEAGNAVSVGTFNNNSNVAKAFGIDGLRPELSRHFYAGVTSKIGSHFTLNLNFYTIKIYDRIALSGRFDNGFEQTLDPLGVGAAQFFTNAFDTRTNGLDARANYRSEWSTGEWVSYIALNVNQTRLDGDIRASDKLIGQENILFNREEIARIESGQPNLKLIWYNSYRYNSWMIGVKNTWFGSVEYLHPADGGDPATWLINDRSGSQESRDQVFGEKLLTDLMLTWQANDNIKATLGANNIFDVYPDKHTHSANIDEGRFIYSRRVQQFGVKGAHFFAKLTLRL